MKILLTGASGFVGSALMRMVEERKDIDILGLARSELDRPNYQCVDVSKPFSVSFVPDVVIHAAALASPWGSKHDYRTQNIETTRQVIRFCEQNNLPKMIYISSSSVFYRAGHQVNITEATPIGPTFINEYAATKYAGEVLVKKYKGDSVILRPRAVFGPYDTVLLPRVLTAAKKGKLPIFRYEGEPAVGDLIYIDVLCDYILKAATNVTITGEYNLTNAQPVEIQHFLFDVLRRMRIPLPTREVSVPMAMRFASAMEIVYRTLRLSGEPPVTRFGVDVFAHSKTFDVSKMLRDFGPPLCSIEEGVKKLIQWQLEND